MHNRFHLGFYFQVFFFLFELNYQFPKLPIWFQIKKDAHLPRTWAKSLCVPWRTVLNGIFCALLPLGASGGGSNIEFCLIESLLRWGHHPIHHMKAWCIFCVVCQSWLQRDWPTAPFWAKHGSGFTATLLFQNVQHQTPILEGIYCTDSTKFLYSDSTAASWPF